MECDAKSTMALTFKIKKNHRQPIRRQKPTDNLLVTSANVLLPTRDPIASSAGMGLLDGTTAMSAIGCGGSLREHLS